MTLLPLIVSGGIHLDGLVDTADALYSRRETEKKLEILKDPHVGAFGVMACCGYLLASFALWGQVYETPRLIGLCCIGFSCRDAVRRWQWSAFRQLRIPDWRICFPAMRIKKRFGFAAVFIFYWQGRCWFGNFYGPGAAVLITIGFVFVGFWHLCRKQFGGITGDLAGFFLQAAELAVLAVCTFGGIMG